METSITPLLTVSDAEPAVDFYKLAFGATEVARHDAASNLSPQSLNGTSVRITLLVEDPDAVFERALESGGKELFPMADQPYGLRQGRVEDPFGHHWMVSKPLDG
jgi:PhnB protein